MTIDTMTIMTNCISAFVSLLISNMNITSNFIYNDDGYEDSNDDDDEHDRDIDSTNVMMSLLPTQCHRFMNNSKIMGNLFKKYLITKHILCISDTEIVFIYL